MILIQLCCSHLHTAHVVSVAGVEQVVKLIIHADEVSFGSVSFAVSSQSQDFYFACKQHDSKTWNMDFWKDEELEA